MAYSDGLDDLTDGQLRELALDMGLTSDVDMSRREMIELLRSYGAISPYARQKPRRRKAKEDEEEPPAEYYQNREREEIQETVDAYTDEYPGEPMNAWLVTLDNGGEMMVYATDRAVDDLRMDHTVTPAHDDMMVSVDETPTYNSMFEPSPRAQQSQRRRPRLPRRRIGQHAEPEPTASIEEQRLKLPRYRGAPPGGGSVSHLPRHRRREE